MSFAAGAIASIAGGVYSAKQAEKGQKAAANAQMQSAQLAIDDVEPAEGDTVTLERVEGTVEGNRDGRILVRITSVGGEPLPTPKKPSDPLDEEADIRRAALASDGLED